MAAKTDSPTALNSPYNIYSDDPVKPVLYTKVSRRRNGCRLGAEPGLQQKEIMEQVFGIYTKTLEAIYFERINPAFPILQKPQFDDDRMNGTISAVILCQIWTSSLAYWKTSNKLHMYPKPDSKYAWNQAVAALNQDFAAPGLPTLLAALLDLNGRPVYSITGNTINNGRTVALAQSLGLNRDPTHWQLTKPEKDLRTRLWWLILIHDRWGAFSHGTPPHICNGQYDVPLPELRNLVDEEETSQERIKSSTGFLALCSLTEILGYVLPLIYDLSPDSESQVTRKLRRLEADLDAWEDSRPHYLVIDQSFDQSNKGSVSGSSSLHLGFLSVKMLHSRIALHKITHSCDDELVESRNYHQMQCRKSAQTIVNFVVNLHSKNLQEFWLPYTAYHLTSTATLLLTCALETTDDNVAHSCILSVRRLVERLQRARDEDDWDLADMCLSHCSGVLKEMSGNSTWNSREIVSQQAPQQAPLNTEHEGPLPLPYDETDSTFQLVSDTALMLDSFQASALGNPTVDLWDLFNFDGNDFS